MTPRSSLFTRRALLAQYSTCVGYLLLFFRYQHTILPTVWSSGFFWTIVASHGVLQGIEHALHDWEDNTVEYHWEGLVSLRPGIDGLPRIDWKAATVSLSLLVFSVVFYINTQYSRYMSLCLSRGPKPDCGRPRGFYRKARSRHDCACVSSRRLPAGAGTTAASC